MYYIRELGGRDIEDIEDDIMLYVLQDLEGGPVVVPKLVYPSLL